MTIDYDDWKLTAFTLGELDDLDRAVIESKVACSPELQAYIEEIRATASVVTDELKGAASVGLTYAQRRIIQERASNNSAQVAPTAGAASRQLPARRRAGSVHGGSRPRSRPPSHWPSGRGTSRPRRSRARGNSGIRSQRRGSTTARGLPGWPGLLDRKCESRFRLATQMGQRTRDPS